ncbi:hypothetical protein [Variovorax saccharolyticus]|uniref:hypothetical protein n=1 Tax=Variovorax saccharolyticus TaxID=3053516 RepID=UPI0025771AB6|nr:hypothetical protein [Variovorax sp. J31P216]
MSRKSRREVDAALAAFDRGCVAFAAGMATVSPPERWQHRPSPSPPDADAGAYGDFASPRNLLSTLGPRKPLKRAQRRGPWVAFGSADAAVPDIGAVTVAGTKGRGWRKP